MPSEEPPFDVDQQILRAIQLEMSKFSKRKERLLGDFMCQYLVLKPQDEYYKQLQKFDILMKDEWAKIRDPIKKYRIPVIIKGKINTRLLNNWIRSQNIKEWRKAPLYLLGYLNKQNAEAPNVTVYYFANADDAVLFKLTWY